MADGGEPSTGEPVAPLTRADILEVVKAVVAALVTTKPHEELGKSLKFSSAPSIVPASAADVSYIDSALCIVPASCYILTVLSAGPAC